VRLTNEVFSKDGKNIPYRKVNLLDDREEFEILMKEEIARASTKGHKRKKKAAKGKPVLKATAVRATPDTGVATALRNWRLEEARRRGVPAFRIFSDKALDAMASARPETAAELLAIPGIGISIVEKYGAQLYRLLHQGRA
jgi:DNA topoisomerase-3